MTSPMTSSPNTGELVARLNKAADHAGDLLVDPPRPTPAKALFSEAAGVLSTLERELEDARAQEAWWKKCGWWEGEQHDYFRSRATRLEAALLKLRPSAWSDTERLQAIEIETGIQLTPNLKPITEPHPAEVALTASQAEVERLKAVLSAHERLLLINSVRNAAKTAAPLWLEAADHAAESVRAQVEERKP